ncbi:CDHR2 protein, partial [Polypterus senegalus]
MALKGFCYKPVPNSHTSDQKGDRIPSKLPSKPCVKITKQFIIIVIDANDNPPIFNGLPYITDVLEDALNWTEIFKVHVTDLDLPSPIHLSIIEVIPDDSKNRGLFAIQNDGSVRLNGTLDYNSKGTNYRLKIFAEGTSVFQVHAYDGDKGINDEIIYSINESNWNGLFRINESSGIIYVNRSIDREELLDINTVVKLKIKAEEKHPSVSGMPGQAFTYVNITITDINDNKPIFYNCISVISCNFNQEENIFVGEIEEHSASGISVKNLTIVARDLDKDENAIFKLELQGPDADAFSVRPSEVSGSSQVDIVAKNQNAIDYENRTEMFVQIIASDAKSIGDCCSTADVTIHVLDKNDNIPTFANDTYTLYVKEHSENDAIIAVITATDPDTADQGKLTYRLEPKSITKYFDVNQKTGAIFVKDKELLDREKFPDFIATLQAIDTSNKIGSTAIELILEDINDNSPRISRDEYTAFVKEGPGEHVTIDIESCKGKEIQQQALSLTSPLTRRAYVGIVTAQDPDQTEINNRITFSFSRGNVGKFIIKSSKAKDNQSYIGNISVAQDVSLDYEEQKEIILSVIASDGDRTADATVNIIVTDVNDEPPKLDATTLQDVSVKENKSTLGIVREIIGTDKDTNHSLVYQLVSTIQCKCNAGVDDTVCRNWFYLDPNGSVIVNESSVIDYEECHQVIMKVKVVDILTEKGVNHSETVVVPEVAKKDDLVTSLSANDRDSGVNKIIEFVIPKTEFISTDGKTLPKNGSFLVRTTVVNNIYEGSVRIATTLDSELKGKYRLTIIAKDMGDPSLSSTTEIESAVEPTQMPITKTYFFVIAGLVVFFIVIFSIMVTALVCTRKSFKRKLKASDALRSAVLITPGNLQTGPVVPGTNQYTMDGANPVLNMKFDTPADLGFDEENSSSDRASFSSLDLNVEMEMTDKDTAPMMIIQEEDEDYSIKEPHYIEPLSAALAQHKNKEPETTMQFINPTLDTTDL